MGHVLGAVLGLVLGAALVRVVPTLGVLALGMLATVVLLGVLLSAYWDATAKHRGARWGLLGTVVTGVLLEATVMLDGLPHDTCRAVMVALGESHQGGWISLPCLSLLLVLPWLVLTSLLGQVLASLVRRKTSP